MLYFASRSPIDFLKVLFFPGWLCHFKGLFRPVWHEIHRLWWHNDNWPSGEWMIFHTTPDTAYVNHFFLPREFVILFKSTQAKQVDHETPLLTRSLRNLMYWSTLHSLLRTYQRSTCSKSRSPKNKLLGRWPLTYLPIHKPGPTYQALHLKVHPDLMPPFHQV